VDPALAALGELLKIGGVAGLIIGVVYLIYKQIISLAPSLFSRLTKKQTFQILSLIIGVLFVLALVALTQTNLVNLKALFMQCTLVIDGSGNEVRQC
jgi:uncharacterized membrane protein